MISPIALATLTSGLAAQTKVAGTAATNIVNATTEGYQAAHGQLVSRPPQGVDYIVLEAEGEVDLGRELVNLTLAQRSYGAAAKAFSSIAETQDTVLDTLA